VQIEVEWLRSSGVWATALVQIGWCTVNFCLWWSSVVRVHFSLLWLVGDSVNFDKLRIVDRTTNRVLGLVYEEHWHNELKSLRKEYKELIKQHLDARDTIQKVHNILNDIVRLAGYTPRKIGKNEAWDCVVSRTEADKMSLCRVLDGKSLFSALYGVYSLNLAELKAVLQHSVWRSVHLLLQQPLKRENFGNSEDKRGRTLRKRGGTALGLRSPWNPCRPSFYTCLRTSHSGNMERTGGTGLQCDWFSAVGGYPTPASRR